MSRSSKVRNIACKRILRGLPEDGFGLRGRFRLDRRGEVGRREVMGRMAEDGRKGEVEAARLVLLPNSGLPDLSSSASSSSSSLLLLLLLSIIWLADSGTRKPLGRSMLRVHSRGKALVFTL